MELFRDGRTADLGSPQAVNASGVAALSISNLAVGTHPITAVFTPTDTAATTNAPGFTLSGT